MNIPSSELLSTCLITGKPMTKILELGQHSFADTFISEYQLHLSEPVFPLELCLNSDSGQIQLGYMSDANDRYNLYPYSYTSSNSKTAKNHWDEYANTIKSKYNTNGLVVEIGSNDGYLIKQFNGSKAIGVDSSKAMCEISEKEGVESINALFNWQVAKNIRHQYGPASIVIANNVLNHSNDPVRFLYDIRNHLLDKDGVLVFEVPYWGCMIDSGRFVDMVYHEHVSYFTIKNIQTLLNRVNLEISQVEVVDYHGGSLRVFAKHGTSISNTVKDAIINETNLGLFDVDFYRTLQRKFEYQRDSWLKKFYEIKVSDPDAVIIGVGAAAKAQTWLNWHGLSNKTIHAITDSSEFKQGKYTSLSRIPIVGDDEFTKHESPYALILSWNIGESLKRTLLEINPNIKFLSQ